MANAAPYSPAMANGGSTALPMADPSKIAGVGEQYPLMAKERQPRIADYFRRGDFVVEWLFPALAFTVTSVLWAYTFLYQPVLCIVWTVLALFWCVWTLVSTRGGNDYPAFKNASYRSLSILGVPAIILGSLFGLYVYDECAVFPQFYANSRKYTNVVPSQPAGAVADAGKLVFAAGSYVDVANSAGLIEEDGTRYCVAPIRDGVSSDRIQFWAAGVDCCGSTAQFSCDDVGDSSASAGIVIFDNSGYFSGANFDHYVQAQKKASAEFGLQSVTYPIYVRWVKQSNLDMLSNRYSWQAVAWLFFGSLLYLGFAFFCTWSLFGAEASLGPKLRQQ